MRRGTHRTWKHIVVLKPAQKMKQHAINMELPAPKSMVVVVHHMTTQESYESAVWTHYKNGWTHLQNEAVY